MDANLLPANFPLANFRASFLVYMKKRLVLMIVAAGKITD